MEARGRGDPDWRATVLDLPHGTPSHDTVGRAFGLLGPPAFERRLSAWTAAVVRNAAGLSAAVDGKAPRRGWRRGWGRTPVHTAGAFASADGVVPGQVATDATGNEVAAVPKLLAGPALAGLELAGLAVTIDAVGCRRAVADRIRRQGGHCVLAVEGNQPTLHAKVVARRDDRILSHAEGGEPGTRVGPCGRSAEANDHGRVETRRTRVGDEARWPGADLPGLWPGRSAVVAVGSARQDSGDPSGRAGVERRYLIASHAGLGAAFRADAARGRWAVENGPHGGPDAAMNEDPCRLRGGHGAEHVSRLRRIAMDEPRRRQIEKENGRVMAAGVRPEQQARGWSRKFLLEPLLA